MALVSSGDLTQAASALQAGQKYIKDVDPLHSLNLFVLQVQKYKILTQKQVQNQAGQAVDPSNKTFGTWLKKCGLTGDFLPYATSV